MRTDFVGKGWNFPLQIDGDGGFALAGGVVGLEQAMRIVLSTYPGERPMRPEFGSRLRDFTFRGATQENATDVAYVVREALARWEPRVTVAEVDVTVDPTAATALLIDINYTVNATNDRRNLVVPFYTIPEDEEA